ncbi:MAG TPA: hypothetical protein PLQ74_12575, partial [Pseudomonadota bacterium]|nr:hypothetical protein [Pseudomonadota bacterium]
MDDAPEGHAARGWPRHIAPLIAALLLALFVTDSWAAPRTVLDLDEAFAFSRARVGGTPGDFVLR